MLLSPLDVSIAVSIASSAEFDSWLTAHAGTAREVVVAIYKQASGQQTVGLVALQETALCHGWVDTQTKRIDDQRYAIRFVPRRPGSNWSVKNRDMARQMLDGGRVTDAGRATLPADL